MEKNWPERAIAKPSRNRATSSDEDPPQKRAARAPSTAAEGFEKDIEDIKIILDKIQRHHSHIPENEVSYYANNKYIELQHNVAKQTLKLSWTIHSNTQPEKRQLPHNHLDAKMIPEVIEKMDNHYRAVNNCLDRMERQMEKMSTVLENIYKSMQKNQRTSAPQRPHMFPISSIAQLRAFEDITEEVYSNVVNYFHYIGGFNSKEAVNLCFKDSIHDCLTPLLTWFGKKNNQEALYNTRLVKAIYDGVCFNRNFGKPLRKEFQAQMRVALRSSKERYRHKKQPAEMRAGGTKIQQAFWSDNCEQEENENI